MILDSSCHGQHTARKARCRVVVFVGFVVVVAATVSSHTHDQPTCSTCSGATVSCSLLAEFDIGKNIIVFCSTGTPLQLQIRPLHIGCLSGALTLDLIVQSSDQVKQVIDLAHARLGNGRALESARLVLLPGPDEQQAWPTTPAEISKICRREPFRPQSRLCREGFRDGSRAVLIYLEEARMQLSVVVANGAGVVQHAVSDTGDDDEATLPTQSIDFLVPTVYDTNGGDHADAIDSRKIKAKICDALGTAFHVQEVKLNVGGGGQEVTWSPRRAENVPWEPVEDDLLLGLLAGAGSGGGGNFVVQGMVTLLPQPKKNGIFAKFMDGSGMNGKLLKDNNPDGRGLTIKDLKQAFIAENEMDYEQLMVFVPGKPTEIEDESIELRTLV